MVAALLSAACSSGASTPVVQMQPADDATGAAATVMTPDSVNGTQVVGKWAGTVRQTGNPPTPVTVEFKPGGVFEGESIGARLGLFTYKGRWKVDGKMILVDFTASNALLTFEASWTLEQEGEILNGTYLRKLDMAQSNVTVKRSK